jgi:hypothetical protein
MIAVEDPVTNGQYIVECAGEQEQHDDPKKREHDYPVVLI